MSEKVIFEDFSTMYNRGTVAFGLPDAVVLLKPTVEGGTKGGEVSRRDQRVLYMSIYSHPQEGKKVGEVVGEIAIASDGTPLAIDGTGILTQREVIGLADQYARQMEDAFRHLSQNNIKL